MKLLCSNYLTANAHTRLYLNVCSDTCGQYIRSYGDLWEGSDLLVTVEGRAHGSSDPSAWGKITQFNLSGVHDSKTSINYVHRADLGDSPLVPGDGLRVTFQLVNGTIFQINGLALCRVSGKTEGG